MGLRDACRRLPAAEPWTRCAQRGVRYVIVHRAGFGPNQWARLEERMPVFLGRELLEVARFGGDTVYELRREASGPL